MRIPLSYSLRNLWTRRLTTVLTASGMALVVFVFAAMLMLAEGLQKTLVETGSPDNAKVIRKSSESEVQSGIDRLQASIIETQPEIAMDEDGQPLLARELVVLMNLPKRGSEKEAMITIRGIGPKSLDLRPQVRLMEGRMPKPGSSEIITGRSVAVRYQGGGDRGDAPFRHEGLEGSRRIRWGEHGLQFRDMGRRRSTHAGIPSPCLFFHSVPDARFLPI